MSNKLFTYYKQLADKAEIKRGTKASMEWFRNKLRKRSQINHSRITEGRKAAKLVPGVMCTYLYDAKLKKKLPYWDETPLIVVLDVKADGWYGVNLHYLPPRLRATLLYELQAKNKTMSQIAAALSKNELTAPCLKKYLSSHVKSRPVMIPKEEWEIAIQMPFENFIGATKKKVWSNAKK